MLINCLRFGVAIWLRQHRRQFADRIGIFNGKRLQSSGIAHADLWRQDLSRWNRTTSIPQPATWRAEETRATKCAPCRRKRQTSRRKPPAQRTARTAKSNRSVSRNQNHDFCERVVISSCRYYAYKCTENEIDPSGQGNPMLALASISSGNASACICAETPRRDTDIINANARVDVRGEVARKCAAAG